MNPRLIAVFGPLSDWVIYLDAPIISIGRQMSNYICIADPYLSREHCLIRSVSGQFIIEDLNSSNGTYLNGEPVKESLLKEVSLIQVGASRFLFFLHEVDELVRKVEAYSQFIPALRQSEKF